MAGRTASAADADWGPRLNKALIELYQARGGTSVQDQDALIRGMCQDMRGMIEFSGVRAHIIPSRMQVRLAGLVKGAAAPPPKLVAPKVAAQSKAVPAKAESAKAESPPTDSRPPAGLKEASVANSVALLAGMLQIDNKVSAVAKSVDLLSVSVDGLDKRSSLIEGTLAEAAGNSIDTARDIVAVVNGMGTLIDRLASVEAMVTAIYRGLVGPADAMPVQVPPPAVDNVDNVAVDEAGDSEIEAPGTAPSVPDSVREFKDMFAGRQMAIIGGTYDENQVRRLKQQLGIDVDKSTWLSGPRTKVQERLASVVRPGKCDLVFVFYPKACCLNLFNTVKALANKYGMPWIDHSSLDPKQIAEKFMAKLAVSGK